MAMDVTINTMDHKELLVLSAQGFSKLVMEIASVANYQFGYYYMKSETTDDVFKGSTYMQRAQLIAKQHPEDHPEIHRLCLNTGLSGTMSAEDVKAISKDLSKIHGHYNYGTNTRKTEISTIRSFFDYAAYRNVGIYWTH